METNEIREKILALRDELYQHTRDLVIDDHLILSHLQKQYESCDKDELVDTITDLLLDSIGS